MGGRNTQPVASFCINQCTKTMAAPGPKSLKYALQVLKYMVEHKEDDILFWLDRNKELVTHYDASF